jgi:hypothetical protein
MEPQKIKSGKIRPASPGSSLFPYAGMPTTPDGNHRGVKTVQVLPTEPSRPEDASLEPGAVPTITADPPIDASGSDPPTPKIENTDSAISKVASLSLKDRLLKRKHRLLSRMYWVQLIFITSSMAAAETTSKFVLAACTFSVVAGVTLDLTARGYVAGAACFGFFCLAFLAATAYFTWQVEDMERIAAKYRAADLELRLDELGGQEQAAASSGPEAGKQHSRKAFFVPPLGPISMTVENLHHSNPEASSLLWLMATAKRISEPFQVTVLHVLYEVLLEDGGTSNFSAPISNLKSYDRAYEKALLDYGKKCKFLKDMLRGSIICKNMKQLRKVWQRLQRLQAEGVLKILQAKNRFRGKPFPTGYRDFSINVEFKGFICEIQLHCEAHYVLKGSFLARPSRFSHVYTCIYLYIYVYIYIYIYIYICISV